MTPDARLDRRLAWGLFALGFIVLLGTEQPAGFVRDESVYFAAAESYAGWFSLLAQHPAEAFTDGAITRFFETNHEHPAGMKIAFGLSFKLLHQGLGLLRPAAAFRVPAFLMAALILPLTFLLGRRLFGRPAGLFAAVSFLLVPRQFFESHLACFDVPIAALWLLVVYAFFEAQARPRWWLYTGLFFGAALATKHNGFFLPLVVIPFSLVRGWQQSASSPPARRLFLGINAVFVFGAFLYGLMFVALGRPAFLRVFEALSPQVALFVLMVGGGAVLLWQLKNVHLGTFRAVAPLVAMAALGPLLFYVLWPYQWHHPVDRTVWYLDFHATHNHYAWFYLGEVLRAPPFPLTYVLGKTALTVPTSLFVPMVLGLGWLAVRVARRQATFLEVLVGVNALASIAIISHPQVPHFGGVKHWFPSMPFLAVLAGGSLWRGAQGLALALGKKDSNQATFGALSFFAMMLGGSIVRGVEAQSEAAAQRPSRLTPVRVFTALALLVALPAVIGGWRVYPWGTSSYSELAGGLPGAATLGMQRQFWANNVTGVLPWINANAKPGEAVYLHECHGGQIRDYQRNGMLRSDLRFVGSPFGADLVAYQYHQEFREQEFNTWEALGTTKPVYGLYVDETPQVVVYRRR